MKTTLKSLLKGVLLIGVGAAVALYITGGKGFKKYEKVKSRWDLGQTSYVQIVEEERIGPNRFRTEIYSDGKKMLEKDSWFSPVKFQEYQK